MTFNEYKSAVKKAFQKYKIADDKIEKYFASQDVKDELQEAYECYNDEDEDIKAASTPEAVASNLYMEL